MATTVTDYRALISGYTWYEQNTTGRPVILTYSFSQGATADVAADHPAAVPTFAALNETERNVVRAALKAWSDVSGVVFLETSRNEGDITFGFYDLNKTGDGGAAGVTYLPGGYAYSTGGVDHVYSSVFVAGGNVAFDTGYRASQAFAGDFLHVALHEIGHALGLKHPFETETGHDEVLSADADKGTNTVMSYDQRTRALTLGPLDIQAIQSLYGPASAKGTQVAGYQWNAAAEQLIQTGTAAGELLRGTGADDVIYSRGGRDVIYTAQGNDVVFLDGQAAEVNGGAGLDTAYTGLNSTQANLVVGGGTRATTLTAGSTQQIYYDVERFFFTNEVIATDTAGNAGQVYRLYQAAFARTPDQGGLSNNLRAVDSGLGIRQAAANFITSAEFTGRYGSSTTDTAFVTALYQNVLKRSPDAAGLSDWLGRLGSGQTRADVLLGFSESTENKNAVAGAIAGGIHLDRAIMA